MLDSENTVLLGSFDSESTLFLDSDSENAVLFDPRVDKRKKVFAAQTKSSEWTEYSIRGLQVTVDICEFGLTNPPLVITSVGRKSMH